MRRAAAPPTFVVLILGLADVVNAADVADLEYKDRLLASLVEKVPSILDTFDSESGRFGTGIWTCRDQHPMYPLAVAYATPSDGNRYYHDPKLLEVIVKSGDPLLENMDERGRWVFAKKDGSTWGMIWMPWTYSRWIRTFQLVGDRMAPELRKAWTDALVLGYTGISKHCLGHVHNIPAHHAMGLYVAGKTLDRPDWCQQAAAFLHKVAAAQSEGGYWSEGGGPVVRYNFVYVDALGTYYAASDDERVLPALEKTAAFHGHFTYPGGQNVETIDQRNPYHGTIAPGNVGFTFTPVGRGYLENQWSRLGIDNLDPDLIASLLLYGQQGPVEPTSPDAPASTFVLSEGGTDRAATVRHGPWFVCLSAYVTPVSTSRWIQDRQSFLSIYHDRTGLILGGGNTKLQPAWSNFTVGDPTLLSHTPGDTKPDFLPKGELYHVPKTAELHVRPLPGLDLNYTEETCRIRVEPKDDRRLEIRLETTADSGMPIAAHLTLIPRWDSRGLSQFSRSENGTVPLAPVLETAGRQTLTLADAPITLSPQQLGGQLTYAGYRLHLPPTATLHWPALPHNPYRKDGRATPSEGRIEIRIPFDRDHREYQVAVEIQ